MKTYDLVMFDLDGTLVETAPEIMDAVNDTLSHFDLPLVSQQQVNNWIGHGTLTLLVDAVAFATGRTAADVRASELLQSMVQEYNLFYQRRCGTRSHLYPQVRETLVALRAQGVRLAVVTNKESRYTQIVMDVQDLSALFDTVISGDSLPTKKPDPAGVAHCLAQWGVSADRALFVGDSSIDVATARNAGVAVWAVPYGYNMGQPIEACAPDRIVADCLSLIHISEPTRPY